MILGLAWPDLIIGIVLIFGLVAGWFRGFINELCGAVALFVGFFAAYHYYGGWDQTIGDTFHLGRGSAHAIAVIGCFAFFYLLTWIVGFILDRIAKLPGLNIANGALGAIVGVLKAGFFAWAVLLVTLLFPLPADLRHDLGSAALARVLTTPNQSVDDNARRALPWTAQPFAKDYLKRDRLNP